MPKVRAGFFSFTEITDVREHRSYNEWHMLDHMPEQYPLPGIVYGQRWVASPACARARATVAPPFDVVHYMTLYLMSDPLDETLREFYALGRELHRLGRFHQHRHSHLSGPFDVARPVAAPRVLVSAEAVPYRPNRGVYVVVGPELDVDAAVAVPGVAGAWSFRPAAVSGEHPWRTGERTVTVCWCDDDPLEVAPSLAALVREGAQLASPFLTITPWEWDWFDETPS